MEACRANLARTKSDSQGFKFSQELTQIQLLDLSYCFKAQPPLVPAIPLEPRSHWTYSSPYHEMSPSRAFPRPIPFNHMILQPWSPWDATYTGLILSDSKPSPAMSWLAGVLHNPCMLTRAKAGQSSVNKTACYAIVRAWMPAHTPVTPVLYVAETGLASSLVPISVRDPISRNKAENARARHLTFSYGIYVHTVVHTGAHTQHTHTQK